MAVYDRLNGNSILFLFIYLWSKDHRLRASEINNIVKNTINNGCKNTKKLSNYYLSFYL